MRRTAFISGADGFVGLNLTRELMDHGWTVIALSLPSQSSPHLREMGPIIVEGDITDKASLLRVFPEDVDAVFHVAADTSLSASRKEVQTKVNVLGTRHMVEAALEKRAKRFVHMSTVAVFGFHQQRIHEQTPSRVFESDINYFKTKAQAEFEVFAGVQQGLDAVIINPANIIGPYDTKGWAQIFIKISEDQFSGIGDGGGSFCHVHEVVRMMREAVDRGKTGKRYILGGVDASFHELAVAAQKVIGGRVPGRPASASMMIFLLWVVRFFSTIRRKEPVLTPEIVELSTNWLRVDASLAQRELGYKQHGLDQMILDSCQWLQDHQILAK